MKQYLLIPALLFCYCFTTLAQQNKKNDNQKDNHEIFPTDITKGKYKTVVENGDTLYTYIPDVWNLQPKADIKTDAKSVNTKTNAKAMQVSGYGGGYMDLSHIPESHAVNTSKDVGEIAIKQGTSSGALSYSIPIDCYQAGNGMSPSVQITYNSMSGNGIAGYGWQIAGVSAISVANSNIYYDGATSAVKANITSAFVLDGMRLINTNPGGDYETEQGNIKVRAIAYGDAVNRFEVYYPNGTIAIYGWGETEEYQPPIFMLSKITDLQGNVIYFQYTNNGGAFCISEITYGGREGNSPLSNYAKIKFTYEKREDISEIYYRGLLF